MTKIVVQDIMLTVKSKRFWISVFLCVFVAALNLSENINYRGNLFATGGISLFLYSSLLGRNLFNYFAPIIAAIPFSSVPLDEMKNGMAKYLVAISNPFKYLVSRMLSAFLLGFSVIVTGLLLNLGLSFLLASNGVAIYDQLEPSVAFRNIFYYSKTLYSYLFILNAGIFGGTYAIFSIGIFSRTKDFYLGYLYPTIIYNVSTMLFGKLCGLNILPFSTFVISQTTIEKLLIDHITIIVAGAVLFMSSFIKWRKSARL